MKHRVKSSIQHWYARLAPTSVYQTAVASVGILLLAFWGTVFLMGLILGMSSDLNYVQVETITELSRIETELWNTYGDSGSVERSIYGLFHWLVAISVFIGIQAVHLGVLLPAWLYPVVLVFVKAFPYLVVGYLVVIIVRLIEIVLDRDVVMPSETK